MVTNQKRGGGRMLPTHIAKEILRLSIGEADETERAKVETVLGVSWEELSDHLRARLTIEAAFAEIERTGNAGFPESATKVVATSQFWNCADESIEVSIYQGVYTISALGFELVSDAPTLSEAVEGLITLMERRVKSLLTFKFPMTGYVLRQRVFLMKQNPNWAAKFARQLRARVTDHTAST